MSYDISNVVDNLSVTDEKKITKKRLILSDVDQTLAFYFSNKDSENYIEQRVVRQFIEAILFEKIVPFTFSLRKENKIYDERFEDIYDNFFVFNVGDLNIHCLGAVKAFDRTRIAEGSVKVFDAGGYYSLTLLDLVESLPMESADKQRLFSELDQTNKLCQWNHDHLSVYSTIRRNLSFQDLESAIHEGHLYHPCFKTRTGFSIDDHEQYGPEAGNTFQLNWLAVSKDVFNQHLPDDEATFWVGEIGHANYDFLTKKLIGYEASWEEYSLVPIHPWQFKKIFNDGLSKKIEENEIIDLGVVGDFYQATQSLRTLVNVSHPSKANVKVPLDIISTSSHRNLQQHFVCSAPVISQWLGDIVENDSFLKLRNNVILLKEYAGLLYEPTISSEATPAQKKEINFLQGRIGAIYRQSVVDQLNDGDSAVPFTALMLIDPDGEPFVVEWVRRYGVEAWLDRLFDVMLIPIWHLLVNQGIAFESHAQNLILVHRNGWPEKIAMRDFHEETEYMPDFLADPNCQPDLESVDPYFKIIPDNEGYRMSSIESLLELFIDTVFIYNLSELSFLLERTKYYSDFKFWSRVKKSLDDYESLEITPSDRIKKIDAFKPSVLVESLLTKKIKNGDPLEYYSHTVHNSIS